MRFVWLAGLAGISAIVTIARPDAVDAIYQRFYPSDPAQRRALDQCFLENHRFDRFDPVDRDACFRQKAPPIQSATAAGPERRPIPAVNFVDQWRAAGEGPLPRNDVRAEQRDMRYLQSQAIPSSR